MKINEITSYDKDRHLVAMLGSDVGVNIQDFSNTADELYDQWRRDKNKSPEEYLDKLNSLIESIHDLYSNDDYWNNAHKSLENSPEFERLGDDWLELENRVENYIRQIQGNN